MSETRSKQIERLEERQRYLKGKRDRRKRAGEPFSFLTDEIRALEWALPILRAHVAKDLARRDREWHERQHAKVGEGTT